MVQPQLNFAQGNGRAVGRGGVAEADIFGDETAPEAQSQPGKFQINAARAQLFHQRPFQKIRQADAVEPDAGADQREHRQPRGDPKPAEADAAFPPETGPGGHIREARRAGPEW